MTVAAVDEVWQVSILGKLEEQDCINVLYFKCVNTSADVETQLLLALLSCYITHIVPILVPAYTFERIVGKQVSPILGPEVEALPTEGMTTAGAADGDGLPSYVSNCISIHTERGGRSGRGRIFLGGFAEADTTMSNIKADSPTWAAIAAFIACVATSFIGSGFNPTQKWTHGVMSRKIGGSKPPFLLTGFARTLSLVPHRSLGTTRSRKVGHGS